MSLMENTFPVRKALPDFRTYDAMAGFLTYHLKLGPPSQKKFQWQYGQNNRLTVTGIVLDFNQLPS